MSRPPSPAIFLHITLLSVASVVPAPTLAQRGPLPNDSMRITAGVPAIDTLALRAYTRFLSDDLLEGRGTGSRGAHLAALYLGSELMRLGLRGAGPSNGYLQRIPMREAVIDTVATRLVISNGGRRDTFTTPADFLVNTGGAGAFRPFSGTVVHAGEPRFAATALKGRDLRGQVVAVTGPLGASALRLIPDWGRRGVAGVLALIPDTARYELYRRSRGESRFYVNASLDDPVWQPNLPVLLVGPEVSRQLLADAGSRVEMAADSGMVARKLDVAVSATVKVDVRKRESANVAGILEGSDPHLRGEYVVYTAHYDHLGISVPDERGDSIYNGFSDDAAGVAMLLAIAEQMKHDPPRRSVLFLFLTGEERGLLGSSYYTTAPLIPLDRTVADINLDAGAPPAPPLDWRLAGAATSTLAETGRRAAAALGWSATASPPSPNSDYWPFLAHGVPALFLIPGSAWEGVSPEQHDLLAERWNHYHAASDEWRADFPFQGLARYAALALAIGRNVANADDRPRTVPAPSPSH